MVSGPILEVRRVSKRFGAVQALADVDFAVDHAEVHALVGDNGAGKSTLIKIISGALRPDSGEIWLEGRRVSITSPEAAKALGIETVYQDLALFDNADVASNMFAGRERTRKWLGLVPVLDKAAMRAFARDTLARLRIEVPSIEQPVRLLSGGQRQSVAIGRAIAFGTRIVIMDEPTAALGAVESAKVLSLVRELKARGLTVIVISHNLQHVFSVADRISVLRQGRMVGVVRPSETSGEAVVRMIVGVDEAARVGDQRR